MAIGPVSMQYTMSGSEERELELRREPMHPCPRLDRSVLQEGAGTGELRLVAAGEA